MKEIQWRDSTPESVRQAGTPSAAKENLRLHGVAYTTMTANKHTTLFDSGVVNQITTPLQVVADDDTQEVQLLISTRIFAIRRLTVLVVPLPKLPVRCCGRCRKKQQKKFCGDILDRRGCGTILFVPILIAAISHWAITLR